MVFPGLAPRSGTGWCGDKMRMSLRHIFKKIESEPDKLRRLGCKIPSHGTWFTLASVFLVQVDNLLKLIIYPVMEKLKIFWFVKKPAFINSRYLYIGLHLFVIMSLSLFFNLNYVS